MAAEKLVSHAATVFPVPDVAAAAFYYRDKLGFEITFEWGDPVTYAVTKRDDAVSIHFSQSDSYRPAEDHTAVYIFAHDVDALYEELRAAGANITNPIGDRDYGMRDFDVTDPNGFVISFSAQSKSGE